MAHAHAAYDHHDVEPSNSGSIVAIVAIIILALLAIAFFVYALPALRENAAERDARENQINIDLEPLPTAPPSENAPQSNSSPSSGSLYYLSERALVAR